MGGPWGPRTTPRTSSTDSAAPTLPASSSDAIALLHEASDGKLRDVDRIATAALKAGAKRKLRQINRGVIASVTSEEGALD